MICSYVWHCAAVSDRPGPLGVVWYKFIAMSSGDSWIHVSVILGHESEVELVKLRSANKAQVRRSIEK